MDDFDILENELMKESAMCVDLEAYVTIKDYFRRYLNTYKNMASEMIVSFEPLIDNMDEDELNDIIQGYGEILESSIRKSDVIVRRNMNYLILFPEMSDEDMISVSNRIKAKLKEGNLCYMISISISSHMIGPDKEYPTRFRVAV